MAYFSAHYKSYLESIQWKVRREMALRRAGFKCEKCGAAFKDILLHVHHITYDRLGKEKPEDLKVLCLECHQHADKERQAEAEDRRWYARLDGFASKKYGDEWEQYKDPEAVEDEFVEWLERKEREDY